METHCGGVFKWYTRFSATHMTREESCVVLQHVKQQSQLLEGIYGRRWYAVLINGEMTTQYRDRISFDPPKDMTDAPSGVHQQFSGLPSAQNVLYIVVFGIFYSREMMSYTAHFFPTQKSLTPLELV